MQVKEKPMRIYPLLIVGLLSIHPFTIHAAGTSGTPRLGDMSSGSSKTSTTASQNQIQSLLAHIQGLMEEIQSLIKDINAVAKERPQPPNTSGISKEKAEKIRKQHAEAIEHWQQKLARLQNKLAALRKKLADAERQLNILKNSYLQTQSKNRQTQQMGLKESRLKSGFNKTVTLNRRILKIQTQSKKQQRKVTQTLKRVQTLLR